MTTEAARRILEFTTHKLMKVAEQSALLDALSSYALEPNEVLEEYERYLRRLKTAYNELDYARDMMCEAVKVAQQQIETLKSL